MKSIIIIIILIIIILYISEYIDNKQNIEHNLEHFTFQDASNNVLFNNIVRNYNKQNYKNVTNIKLNGNLTVKEQELSKYICNLKYPVGSYYIQYPENNNNNHWETEEDLKKFKDEELTFPKSKSPPVLFGGKWENIFKNTGIYFRTPGIVANENRVNGYQPGTINRLYGTTSLSQTNLWNPGYGVNEGGILSTVLLKERIGTDGKKKSDKIKEDFKKFGLILAAILIAATFLFNPAAFQMAAAVGSTAVSTGTISAMTVGPWVAIAAGAAGIRQYLRTTIPGAVDTFRGQFASRNRGSSTGHNNIFNNESQSKVSPGEIRIRNRLIKVWKRIE
jgi:hypothetical protein